MSTYEGKRPIQERPKSQTRSSATPLTAHGPGETRVRAEGRSGHGEVSVGGRGHNNRRARDGRADGEEVLLTVKRPSELVCLLFGVF